MRSKLDRIEASVQDAEDGRWCSLETVDAAALVAVARAAESLIADREGAHVGERRLALREALSRLGKDTAA